MKNYWTIFAALIATGAMAQPLTNAPLPAPAAAGTSVTPGTEAVVTNAPETKVNAPPPKVEKKETQKKTSAKKSAKKATDKKGTEKAAVKKKDAGADLKTVPLVAGKATVIASNVNVRGQAKLKSEVVTRLDKNQEVAVLEEVILKKSARDEPSAWAK